jgi:hypothetical protein
MPDTHLELPGGSDFKWKREQSALYMQAQDSQQAIDKEGRRLPNSIRKAQIIKEDME